MSARLHPNWKKCSWSLECLSSWQSISSVVESAGGGEMHYYCEQELLADGSKQKDIWGAGFEPDTQEITYDSLINIRAPQNRSMEIENPIIRERVAEIVIELLGGI